MENYLLKFLNAYFEEILTFESKLSIIETFLKYKTEDIIAENRSYKTIYTAITSYQDLSIPSGQPNNFIPNHYYRVDADILKQEVDEIISQQCALYISQVYEAFDTFLLSSLTEYIFNNHATRNSIGIENESRSIQRSLVRKKLRMHKEANNKGLFELVKKFSICFKDNVNYSGYGFKILDWFDMIAEIRHIIIHKRQEVPQSFIDSLGSKCPNDAFDAFFSFKIIRNKKCIYTNKGQTSGVIFLFNSLAHLIFKSLSIEVELPVNVPQYVVP